MPEKIYILTHLPIEKLIQASDMLRYDGAFELRANIEKGECEVHLTSFTPGRWKSFGVNPGVPVVLTYEKKAFERKQGEATGFIRGLKVCQSHLFDKEREKHGGVHLVEDANPEIYGHWPEKEA